MQSTSLSLEFPHFENSYILSDQIGEVTDCNLFWEKRVFYVYSQVPNEILKKRINSSPQNLLPPHPSKKIK